MTLTEKLDLLMKEKGIDNISELSKLSNIPYMTIRNFYIKGTDNIKLSTLKQLANFFDVSLDYIADDNVNEKSPAKSEGTKNNIDEIILEKINMLPEDKRNFLISNLDFLISGLKDE